MYSNNDTCNNNNDRVPQSELETDVADEEVKCGGQSGQPHTYSHDVTTVFDIEPIERFYCKFIRVTFCIMLRNGVDLNSIVMSDIQYSSGVFEL